MVMLHQRHPPVRSAAVVRAVSSAQLSPPGRTISQAAPHALNSFLSSTSRSMCSHRPGAWEATSSAACRAAAAGS